MCKLSKLLQHLPTQSRDIEIIIFYISLFRQQGLPAGCDNDGNMKSGRSFWANHVATMK